MEGNYSITELLKGTLGVESRVPNGCKMMSIRDLQETLVKIRVAKPIISS